MTRTLNSRCRATCAVPVLLTALLVCCSSSGLPQTKASSVSAPISYETEAVVVEKAETVFRYDADGTGEKVLHERLKVQNEAGARQFSVLSFPYGSANENAEIQSLLVHHPDGTTTETPAADAIDMPSPVTQQAPLFSDLKVLQIPVRSLRAGDTIEFRVLIRRKNAESPSQFWGNFSFMKGIVVLDESLMLDVPAGKYVQVWNAAAKPTVTENAGRHVSVWSNSQLAPTASGQKKDESAPESSIVSKPDVAWTTFHSWQEVGEWYRALSAPRAVATDALRAKANEITREAKTPLEQIQALYSFVSTHIRFVGVDFGIGRYQPHAAAEVLANQYGDCKDKDTLLEALLHASGFTTAPALVGVNIDIVSELPSPAFFNHLITTVNLPSGKLWMDSTPGVAPFQLLLSSVRDKEALVIPLQGIPDIERTPAQTPFPFVDHFEAKATLKADGELTGHVDIDYRSDSEIAIRMVAQNLAPTQWDQGSQYIANLMGFSGTTSNSTFARADDTSVPMRISYDYTRKPFGDWDNFRIVPLFPVNTLPAAPDKLPTAEIDLGALRTESAVSRIRLPDGFSADLPDAVHVQTPFAAFDKSNKLEDGELISERKLVILKLKLPADSWEQYTKFTKDISLGDETWIQLTSGSSAGNGPHPPKPGENNPSAAQLVTDATVLERNQDWVGALKNLDEARDIQPKQPYLWSNYGYVAMLQNKPDEAKEGFRHELSLHPDEGFVVNMYAQYLHRRGEDQEARAVLSAYFQNDASDAEVALLLASIQAKTSLPDAIATLRRASEAAPRNVGILSALGDDLVANHQNDDAKALADKMLAGTNEDPNTLNDASYLLAETNSELPLAEQKVRRALEILDGETSTATISEANEQTFHRNSLLVATWDTLGFILLKENKLDEARDYLEAAWKNGPSPVVGGHYGQLLEALGNLKGAFRIYEQIRSPLRAGMASPAQQQIDDSIARLKSAGIASSGNKTSELSLQDERTFRLKFKSPGKVYESATYRLQIGASATQAVMRVSGDPVQGGAEEAIKRLALPHLVPSHSAAQILRDAVLTCSPGQTECFFVLMPMGGMQAENQGLWKAN
jgi:tetratricopeptide (TPR) repeat protein